MYMHTDTLAAVAALATVLSFLAAQRIENQCYWQSQLPVWLLSRWQLSASVLGFAAVIAALILGIKEIPVTTLAVAIVLSIVGALIHSAIVATLLTGRLGNLYYFEINSDADVWIGDRFYQAGCVWVVDSIEEGRQLITDRKRPGTGEPVVFEVTRVAICVPGFATRLPGRLIASGRRRRMWRLLAMKAW